MATDVFKNPDRWVAEAQRHIEAHYVNQSFASVAARYPAKFSEAYKWLTSLDPANPKARRTVQAIWNARDPGKALIRWYDGKVRR